MGLVRSHLRALSPAELRLVPLLDSCLSFREIAGRLHLTRNTVKTRNRHAGWQYVHRAVDDHSRLAYAEILRTESPRDCASFLRRAVAWYTDHGITVERVISDNGNGYRSYAWRDVCAELSIHRRYTRPRRPQTNGKAKALVKTLLREWAYRYTYPTSSHRARALDGYLRWYNRHRPHGSLGGRPPISRISHLRGQHNQVEYAAAGGSGRRDHDQVIPRRLPSDAPPPRQ